MTRRSQESAPGVNPSVRILTSVGFAILVAASIAAPMEVRGLFDRPHSVLLDPSAAEADQCVVERGGMTSSGNDAKLFWGGFSGADIRLDIEVDAGESTFLDAFWGTPDQPSFSSVRCVRIPLSPGLNRLAVPIRGAIRGLRLDFGDAPGQRFRVSFIRSRSGLRLVRPWTWSVFGLRCVIFFVPAFLLLLHIALPVDRIWCFIDRNRFALAAGVLTVAVILEIHGSSIGMWNRFIPNGHAEPPLLGVERSIRSDEYVVFTPMTLAQSFAKPAWPYFNDIPRAARTDMYSVYAQPVRHPLLVFRPFLAGHVLFGFRRGLSFFWVGRWLALFLAMYGLFKLLTKGDKPLSAIAAVLVLFSPVVQWWGAINALAEMLIFGSLFVLCLDRFMAGSCLRDRWIPALGMGYSGVCYAMTLYPAAMVPLAYVFGSLCLWTAIRRANGFRWDFRSLIFVILVAVLAAGSLAWYLHLSADSFRIVSGTEYPGRRFSCGGGFRKGLGLSSGGLFFPWTTNEIEDGNPFERAMFLDFFPLGLSLAAFVFIRRGARDAFVVLLLAVSVLLGAYCFFGLPPWFAKLSGLSWSIKQRAFVAFSFVQFLLIVRCVALLHPVLPSRAAIVSALAFSSVATMLAHLSYPNYLSPFWLFLVFSVGFSGCLFFLRFHVWKLAACTFFTMLALASGAFVNPVQRGDAGVLDSDLARVIRSIAEKDHGAWLVEGASFPVNQYPLLVGAPTINAGNLYPALDRWRGLDPERKAEPTWNRYAVGIRVDLRSDEPPSFLLTGFDTFRISAPPEQLVRWGVRHVLSRRDLESLSGDSVRFCLTAHATGWNVYSVETDD